MTKAEELIKDVKSDKRFKKLNLKLGNDPELIVKKHPFDIEILDDFLNGGLPLGKFVLIYGEFSTGKTFLVQKLIASAQRRGMSFVYIDVDKSYEPDWWETVGVDVSNVPVAQPNHGEQVFDLAVHLAEKERVDIVVIDSLDLLVPTVEMEASMDDQTMNLSLARAKLISTGLRKLKRANDKTLIVGINHIAKGIGKFSQYSIPGGKAQEDFSSVMMWLSRGGIIKDAEDETKKIGFNMRIMLEKDKIHGKRYQSVELPFIFEGGIIDTLSGLIALSIDLGAIVKKGGWYDFADQHIRGKLNVRDFLEKNPSYIDELKKQVEKVKDNE